MKVLAQLTFLLARYCRAALWMFLLMLFALNTHAAPIPAAASLVFPPYGHSYGIRKATPAQLAIFLQGRTQFDNPEGLATIKMISRDDPSKSNDDDEVVVYGVNSGRGQLIYNTSMWAIAQYGSRGSGVDQLSSPRGVACDAQGNVFVADWGNSRVVHLFNPKKEVRWVASLGTTGARADRLQRPCQIGLASDSTFFVTDSAASQIFRYTYSGRMLLRISSRKEFAFEQGPTTLAVADGRDAWSYFREDRFLVCADRGGKRLWKISFDGLALQSIQMPHGYVADYAAVDFYHNVWITDRYHHVIVKFDRNLKLLDVFGSYGEKDNQFIEPRGIAIYKRFGQVFIAEKSGAQYYWVGNKCTRSSLYKTAQGKRIDFFATEYSYASLFKAQGSDTAWHLRSRFMWPGYQSLDFSLKELPNLVGEGHFYLRIEPTYSSYKYYRWNYPLTFTP